MRLIARTYVIAAAMVGLCASASAQSLRSAYFSEAAGVRHTMNPALADSADYVAVPLVGNVNMAMHGNFGYEDLVRPNPAYGHGSDKRMATFLHPQITAADALDGFATGKNRLGLEADITLLAAGFKAFGGYNTVELRSRTAMNTAIPYEFFAFAKNTGNRRYDIGDIDMQAQSYAELAFGHSRRINDRLRLGAKVKLLFGIVRADIQMRNMTADLSADDKWVITGEAQADVSMKGFKYVSKREAYREEERGYYRCVNDAEVDGAGLGGFGLAADLGAEYRINSDGTLSAALLDLGFISWNDNARAVNAEQSFVFEGFHDISVASDRGEKIEDKADRYADQLADFANLRDVGRGSRTTGLAATVNVGCEYTLPVYRKITFGALSSTRINGPYTWTECRLSANWKPLTWLDGGISLAANSFATSCGWIINIHPAHYNFFIGMDHILGKTSAEGIPLSSNASLAIGMNITW